MELIKEILFWWMLIYNILVLTSKTIRTSYIKFLKDIDN